MQFIALFKDNINAMDAGLVLTPEGEHYSQHTIRNWRSKIGIFEDYEISLGSTIVLQQIDYDFCIEFKIYLFNRQYCKNTVSNILSILKAFLNRLFKKKLVTFNGSGLSTPMELTTAVYNTVAELRELLLLNLPPGKARVRDMYVIQCFLGLRVGDALRLLNNYKSYIVEMEGKPFFKLHTQKTKETVYIPAFVALQVLEQSTISPKLFSQQYYRRELKEIFRGSALDRPILFYRTEGGQRVERTVMFSDLVCTHTARRSFATNAYLAGMGHIDIMKMTGHKTYNAFIKYIRADNMETALKVSEHPFFNIKI